eukprot:522791-Pleurochrysis_carterae.AAC.3
MRAFCSSPDVPIGLYHKAAESTLHLVSDAMDQLAEEMPKVEIETEYAVRTCVYARAWLLCKNMPKIVHI